MADQLGRPCYAAEMSPAIAAECRERLAEACLALGVYDHLWKAQQGNMQIIVRNESTDEEQPLLLL